MLDWCVSNTQKLVCPHCTVLVNETDTEGTWSSSRPLEALQVFEETIQCILSALYFPLWIVPNSFSEFQKFVGTFLVLYITHFSNVYSFVSSRKLIFRFPVAFTEEIRFLPCRTLIKWLFVSTQDVPLLKNNVKNNAQEQYNLNFLSFLPPTLHLCDVLWAWFLCFQSSKDVDKVKYYLVLFFFAN